MDKKPFIGLFLIISLGSVGQIAASEPFFRRGFFGGEDTSAAALRARLDVFDRLEEFGKDLTPQQRQNLEGAFATAEQLKTLKEKNDEIHKIEADLKLAAESSETSVRWHARDVKNELQRIKDDVNTRIDAARSSLERQIKSSED